MADVVGASDVHERLASGALIQGTCASAEKAFMVSGDVLAQFSQIAGNTLSDVFMNTLLSATGSSRSSGLLRGSLNCSGQTRLIQRELF
jgi:hypothetical protein